MILDEKKISIMTIINEKTEYSQMDSKGLFTSMYNNNLDLI